MRIENRSGITGISNAHSLGNLNGEFWVVSDDSPYAYFCGTNEECVAYIESLSLGTMDAELETIPEEAQVSAPTEDAPAAQQEEVQLNVASEFAPQEVAAPAQTSKQKRNKKDKS